MNVGVEVDVGLNFVVDMCLNFGVYIGSNVLEF